MAEYIDIDDQVVVTDTRGRELETTVRHILEMNKGVYTAVDVRPVVRGKWKLGGYGQISDATEKWYDQFLSGCFFYCSVCKERSSTKTHFCPNCGAMMEES